MATLTDGSDASFAAAIAAFDPAAPRVISGVGGHLDGLRNTRRRLAVDVSGTVVLSCEIAVVGCL